MSEGQDRLLNESPLLPHEQRALNFLVNEYLLQHNYKLTAITFAEEDDNQDQDFDDWDEVRQRRKRDSSSEGTFSQSRFSCHFRSG